MMMMIMMLVMMMMMDHWFPAVLPSLHRSSVGSIRLHPLAEKLMASKKEKVTQIYSYCYT